MKRLTTMLFLAALLAFSLAAQDAAFLDRASAATALAPADAAYLVMVAAERSEAGSTPEKALEAAIALGAMKAGVGDRLNLGEYSLLVMKAFGLKGGLFFSLFPSPRYAYKELVYKGFLQGDVDPADPLSGALALRVVGAVLETRE